MTTPMWRTHAALVALIALGMPFAAWAQTVKDPWKRVPATPTSCFADDDFSTKLNATRQQTVSDLIAQDEANVKAKERFDAMDMSERARRMQAYMMKNPQEAAKMLQATQDVSESNTSTTLEVAKVSERLDKELAEHKSAFDAAVDKAVKPVQARLDALVKAKTVGDVIAVFPSAADHAQYVALIGEQNAAYERACAPYFAAKGKFHVWLDSYKQDVIDKMIAAEEASTAAVAVQMQIMDVPMDVTSGKLRGVREYLRNLYNITGYRRAKAEPTIQLAK
jgi:hypothetical protein